MYKQEWLQPTTKKRIGIQWGSNGVAFITKFRKMELVKLLEIARPDVEFVCLSFDLIDREKQLLQQNNVLVPELGDFDQTAKVMIQCDLIVTVDTVTAHLAGALGVPTWVMLSQYACDWRWFMNRSDSPFYSCMKLFRQTDNTWDSVIEQLKIALDNK
jgi:ADP-heptose:LPS heptosyltransferase